MKKIYALMTACAVLVLGGCAQQKAEEWTSEGYYQDENGNILSITYMEDIDEPGWYVGCMLGGDPIEDSWGGTLPQEGNTLHGTLISSGSREDLEVTVSEEAADVLTLKIEGGETYRFTKLDLPEATIFVTINTEGWGNIDHAEGEEVPEVDPEYPFQFAVINLDQPTTYTFIAWPRTGNLFVKWTKNGEDYSTEPVITVLLDESADYVAVFEEDPDWQNPVMNYVGNYQCDRARAVVESIGFEDAIITIQWAGSASELAQWDIYGTLDPETGTIAYMGCGKSIITNNADGEITDQEQIYGDGTGTIVFHDDGTFTWHDDQSDTGNDLVFEWLTPENE